MGQDPTNEVGNDEIKNTKVEFTNDQSKLQEASFFIIAVPTPVNNDHTPNLEPVISASEIVGRNMMKDSIVVYESTVYPGCTENVCIPILERESKLKFNIEFEVGYSPERINPGDKVHRLENIKKIVSGCNYVALSAIKSVYDIVIEAGTYPVSSIKTAEAIKLVENSQRDINIAFMNELAMAFDHMGIDTNEVVNGMNTKWNALGFRPGLVGGHCIGVDPYYFTYEAERLGYHSQIVLNGRNSNVYDIIKQLRTYGIEPMIVDPWADREDAYIEYGVKLYSINDIKNADCIIVAVAHRQFVENRIENIENMFGEDQEHKKVLIDVKGIYDIEFLKKSNIYWWRL